jgi:hypothetical protein
MRRGQVAHATVGRQADGVRDGFVLAVVVEGWDGKAAVGTQFDLDGRSAGPEGRDRTPQDGHYPVAGVDCPGAQDGRNQLIGVPVEDEQQVIHMLAVVAVIAAAFLGPVRGSSVLSRSSSTWVGAPPISRSPCCR